MSAERVAYLTNVYPKVSHTFIRREILALEAQGVEVLRFAFRGWDEKIVDSDDLSEKARTRYTLERGVGHLIYAGMSVLLRHPTRFIVALKTAFQLSRNSIRPWYYHLLYLMHACQILLWLSKESPKVTHLHAHFGTNPTDVALLIRKLGGPSFSFTVHGMNEIDDAKRLHLGRKVAEARFAISICSFTKAQLLREVDTQDWGKIKIVHCGLNKDFFVKDTPPLPRNPNFLCVGRFSPEKAHLILLEAFSILLKKVPQAKLTLAGDGELRSQIEEKAIDLGISQSVTITGWIAADQVRELLTQSHVLVQPSFIEGLPVVLMEAMAMRRAVISTYVAGIPELVVPKETGWLVPASDVESLCEAMLESVMETPEKLNEMGISGQTRALARHNVETEARKLRSLFLEGSYHD